MIHLSFFTRTSRDDMSLFSFILRYPPHKMMKVKFNTLRQAIIHYILVFKSIFTVPYKSLYKVLFKKRKCNYLTLEKHCYIIFLSHRCSQIQKKSTQKVSNLTVRIKNGTRLQVFFFLN